MARWIFDGRQFGVVYSMNRWVDCLACRRISSSCAASCGDGHEFRIRHLFRVFVRHLT
jgi:hypothetical protein